MALSLISSVQTLVRGVSKKLHSLRFNLRAFLALSLFNAPVDPRTQNSLTSLKCITYLHAYPCNNIAGYIYIYLKGVSEAIFNAINAIINVSNLI